MTCRRAAIRIRSTIVAGMATAMLIVAPTGADAHSDLTRSVPAANATVEVSPDMIELVFSDPVQMPEGVTAVLDLEGRDYVDGPPIVNGRTARIPIRAGEPGTRVVSWQAISDHGSPVGGSFSYNVGAPTPSAVNGASNVEDQRGRLEVVVLARSIAAAGVLVLLACAVASVLAIRRQRDATPAIAVALGAGIVVIFSASLGAWIAWGDHRDVSWWLLAVGAVGVYVLAAHSWWRRARLGSIVTACLLGALLLAGVGAARTESLPPATIERDVALGDRGRARVTIDPAVAGFTDITVTMLGSDGEGGAEAPAAARLRYRPTNERITSFRVDLEPDGEGRFVARDALVPFDGRWEFEVGVSYDRFSAGLATFEADVRADEEDGT
jgi:methionine-rich copper-binding protein CopC